MSKSEIKRLNEQLRVFQIVLSKKDVVEEVKNDFGEFLVVEGRPWFLLGERLIPHLELLQERPSLLPRVVVDMGAVGFVTNGADVMRPGVTFVEDGVALGTLVVVVDEHHGKPLAVGEALLDAEGMRRAPGGKVVKNLHWIGDKVWNVL